MMKIKFYFSHKNCLRFPVLLDAGNETTRQFCPRGNTLWGCTVSDGHKTQAVWSGLPISRSHSSQPLRAIASCEHEGHGEHVPVAPVCPSLLLGFPWLVHGPCPRSNPFAFLRTTSGNRPRYHEGRVSQPRQLVAQLGRRASRRRGGILIDGTQARWASISPCSMASMRLDNIRTASEKPSAPIGRPEAWSSETYCSMCRSSGSVGFFRSHVHWMHPVDELRLSHRPKISDILEKSPLLKRAYSHKHLQHQ